jgi:hypothetical protein
MEETLQGSVSRFKIPEIFQLLANSRKTGTLGIQKDDDIVMVYFKNGRIMYAYGPRQSRHLGQMLKEQGKIDDGQLREAVNTQAAVSLSKRLGHVLIEKGFIDRADLAEAVSEQIQELIYSLLSWEEGSFKFYDNQYPTREEITVDLSVENVILEGIRRVDEVNRLREHLPDYNTVLKIDTIGAGRKRDISLETEEWNLLARIDGQKTIRELIEESGLGEMKTLEKLATLQLAGLITIESEPEKKSDRLAGMVNRVAGLLEEYLENRTPKPAPRKIVTEAIEDKA